MEDSAFYAFNAPRDEDPKSMQEVIETLGLGKFQIILFIICGLATMADACEVNLLTFSTQLARDEWNLTAAESASIASVVFAGEFIGGFIWGPISDRFGRRRAFFYSLSTTVFLGLLSAASTGFLMLLGLRFLVGIGVAGIGVPFVILIEMVPKKWRSPMGLYIQGFWSIGSVYVATSAWLTAESLGWRWLTVLTSLPLLLALLCYPWLPESPRWLLDQGKLDQAQKIIDQIARVNGVTTSVKIMNVRKPVDNENTTTMSQCKRIFTSPLNKVTSMLFAIGLFFGFAYYGVVIFDHKVFSPVAGQKFDYQSIFFVSIFEVVGLLAADLLSKTIRSEKAQSLLFLVAGLGTVLLSLNLSTGWLVLLMGIGRGAVFGAQAIFWVVTPEHYPTLVRSTAYGLCYAVSRIGSFATPYWGNSSFSVTTIAIVYFSVDILAAIFSYCLPTSRKAIDEQQSNPNVLRA